MTTEGPLSAADVDKIREGYAFEGESLEMGALVNGDPQPDVQIKVPLGMLNRHGLIAGATGTGKTKTLQGLAEQLSAKGVPVFAADIKGDLSGLATPGTPSDKLTARTQGIGQNWQASAAPVQYFSLGGVGKGVPLRATVSSFGPLLLAKVLGLNETQEASLGLVFHYADTKGLPLVDLGDLRAVLQYLTDDDEGKKELKELGGVSPQTAGVILRQLTTFANKGADEFFGETEIDTKEFLQVGSDGRGLISLLEVPGIEDQPEVFSTFLMWLLADLFHELPEVGDADKPKLVFFFDEAHLLFDGASKEFVQSITQTVRLIRSKGVGIFFVTQTPKDVPGDVLGQLGSRVQHALRAFTPDDAKALKATVSTYPKSGYDLEEVLTTLGTGEAIVTVMSETGAPTPVAWTRMRAPESAMSPTDAAEIDRAVASSPLMAKYGQKVDPESAYEILTRKMQAADQAEQQAEAEKQRAKDDAQRAKDEAQQQKEQERREREYERQVAPQRRTSSRSSARDPFESMLRTTGNQVAREVVRGLFGLMKGGRR